MTFRARKFPRATAICACTSRGNVSHVQKKLCNRTHPVPGAVKQIDVNKWSGLSLRHSSSAETQDASSAAVYFMSISIVIESKSCKRKKKSWMEFLIIVVEALQYVMSHPVGFPQVEILVWAVHVSQFTMVFATAGRGNVRGNDHPNAH